MVLTDVEGVLIAHRGRGKSAIYSQRTSQESYLPKEGVARVPRTQGGVARVLYTQEVVARVQLTQEDVARVLLTQEDVT